MAATKLLNPGGYEPGVYFGLPEEDYHADPALGSTSMKAIFDEPYDYWWNSWMNPNRPPEKESTARTLGSAIHKLVLEGKDLFDQEYICGPMQEGMTSAEKSASTKKANAEAAERGVTVLKYEDYVGAVSAAAQIAGHPQLATALQNGEPEVSVFWERDGIMRKARIDYLKPRGLGDLKTLGDRRGRSFPEACMNSMDVYMYDMQAAHYLEGRAALNQHVKAGRILGENFDRDWLNKLAAIDTYAFQWIFISTSGAPSVWSTIMTPGNGILDYARNCLDVSAGLFRDNVTKHGFDAPWITHEPVTELTMDDLPPWFGRNRARRMGRK